MTIADLAQDVQFTIDHRGHITAVIISPVLWHKIIDMLEDSQDRDLVQSLRERLGQHPMASGALRWQDVAQEWE